MSDTKPETVFRIGGRYNWKGQTERLVFIGRNWSGNWNQFERVGEPGVIWCEVLDSDLHMLEETIEATPKPETIWKMMPFPATEEMLTANPTSLCDYSINAIYKAMFNVAPPPPQPEPISMEPVAIYQHDPLNMAYGIKWLTDKTQTHGTTYYPANQLAALEAKAVHWQGMYHRERDLYDRQTQRLTALEAKCERLKDGLDELLAIVKKPDLYRQTLRAELREVVAKIEQQERKEG
jgi:hypothetical protein